MKKPSYGRIFLAPGTIVNTALPQWKWLEGVVPDVEVTALNQDTFEWLRSVGADVRKPKQEN
jgi:hypothetical protein